MPTLLTFIQHNIGSNQTRKRKKKGSPNRKGRSKTVTEDEIILYTENPKDTIKKTVRNNK